MRYAFSLVGLLVTVGIIVWLMSIDLGTGGPVEKGLQAQDAARQISGRGQDNIPANRSYKADELRSGDRLTALKVTEVTTGGAMDQYYGLKAGDEIIAIGTQISNTPQKLNDIPGGEEMVKPALMEAYQAGRPIIVRRNGEELTLPRDKNGTKSSDAAETPSHSTTPQEQLNNILKRAR